METLFILLSFFSVAYIIRQASFLDKPRDWLLSKSVLFYKLISCPFCLGFHTGYLTYIAYNSFSVWSLKTMLLWALASATVNYFAWNNVITSYELV